MSNTQNTLYCNFIEIALKLMNWYWENQYLPNIKSFYVSSQNILNISWSHFSFHFRLLVIFILVCCICVCTVWVFILLNIYLFHLCSIWDLSSLSRDQTYDPCVGSVKFLTTEPPGSPLVCVLSNVTVIDLIGGGLYFSKWVHSPLSKC